MRGEASTVLLCFVISLPGVGCAVDGAEPGGGDCEALAAELADCGGGYESFAADCAADPDGATTVVEGACSGDKGDSITGWRDNGERCFNFNFECSSGLFCVPRDEFERDHFCEPAQGLGAWCDEDDDCGGDLMCIDENLIHAGMCKPPIGLNERCYGLNLECAEDYVCRPLDEYETDHFCLPIDHGGGWCDDDDDCADGLFCIGQNTVHAGRCLTQ